MTVGFQLYRYFNVTVICRWFADTPFACPSTPFVAVACWGLLGYSWQGGRRLIFNLNVRKGISFLLEVVSTRRSLLALGAGMNPGSFMPHYSQPQCRKG